MIEGKQCKLIKGILDEKNGEVINEGSHVERITKKDTKTLWLPNVGGKISGIKPMRATNGMLWLTMPFFTGTKV